MSTPRDTVETVGWTNRELLLRIYYQTVETNGTVRQHDLEIYGRPEHGFVGLRQIANENVAYRERVRTAMKILAGIGAGLFGLLTTVLILLLEHAL